jgi:hypothetical protein
MNGRVRDAGPLPALHNMSAPPRSTAEIRPMRPGPRNGQVPRGWGGHPASLSSGPSGTFFARVHLVGLLADGRSHVARGADIARGVLGGTPDLADAVAMLRTGRKTGKALAAASRDCAALPFATLHAEFLERVASLGDAGLPPLLLARPMNASAPVLRTVAPAVAIRLLAGTAGGLFVRSRAPSADHFLSGLPGAAVPWEAAFDYYEPARHERPADRRA